MPGHVVIAVLGNTYFLHSLLPYLSMNIFCTPSFLTFLGIFFTLPLSFLFYEYFLHSLVPSFSRNIFYTPSFLPFLGIFFCTPSFLPFLGIFFTLPPSLLF